MTRRDLQLDWSERKRRAAVVKQWRGERGDLCPGYGVPAHASEDLTADHVVPVAAGGDPRGPLGVLCRPCNSRKRDGRRADGRTDGPTWRCPVDPDNCHSTVRHSIHW